MGWWTECIVNVAGLAPRTAGPCQWTNMDGRYPFSQSACGQGWRPPCWLWGGTQPPRDFLEQAVPQAEEPLF